MQFTLVAVCSVLLVSGIRCDAEPLSGASIYKEGHHDYLQPFHHGQQHPSGTPEGVSPASYSAAVGSQDASSAASQEQVAHSTGSQVGPIGQVGSHVLPSYGGLKSGDIPLHFGARAIAASPYPYLYGKAYASPYYAPYQPAGPYGGYYPSYPYHQFSQSPYTSNPYSVTPYSASVYPGSVGYSGYQGGPGNYGYVPPYYPGYSQYYQPSAEVQQSSSKQ